MPKKESNIIKRTLDLKKPPPLSAEQKARLDAVASMPNKQIDYSDAPACLMRPGPNQPHKLAPDSLLRVSARHDFNWDLQ